MCLRDVGQGALLKAVTSKLVLEVFWGGQGD